MSNIFSQGNAMFLYNVFRKYFTISNVLTSPVIIFIDAPFGRFSPSQRSPFLVNGIYSWIVMELVSPAVFLYTYINSPLSTANLSLPSFSSPQSILATLFLIHYVNRAIISPLRTPSRSKSHLIVPLSGVTFNMINGFLMGAYLSSPFARIFLNATDTYARASFYLGIGLWAVGFIGNITHDEILLNIRRKAKSKGKDKEGNGTEHYAIPQGLLYSYISYPNYFCEWVEWFGFALAASPLPLTFALSSTFSVASVRAFADAITIPSLAALASKLLFSLPSRLVTIIQEPAYLFAPSLSPPWVFFIGEVALMLPRAYKGHLWYHSRFGAAYPEERRVVIPFVF